MENCLATPKFVFPCPPGASLQVTGRSTIMQEFVALVDVPDGDNMLPQNLQIVASFQGNVLGEEENTPSAVISAENTPYHYALRVFHRITVDLES